jgi:peptidoglycan/LPS O-acetylase OafA/YrhL
LIYFFVISGFLITSLIVKNLKSDDFSFVDFYQRRIRRIFPALVLVMTACFLFGRVALYSGENQQLGKHILGGASFVSNLILWGENGYFDNSADTKPLLHLWSLGVEEQFYIVWPVMLWVGFKLRLNLIALVLVVGLASFILNVTEIIPNSVAAFYSPQTRLWELLVGALLAARPLPSLTADQKSALSIGGGIMIAAGLLVVTSAMAFPGWWALLPTIATAMVIAAGPSAVLNRTIGTPTFVWFGLISFPLYLWHWPLLSFARIIRGSEPTLLRRTTYSPA